MRTYDQSKANILYEAEFLPQVERPSGLTKCSSIKDRQNSQVLKDNGAKISISAFQMLL